MTNISERVQSSQAGAVQVNPFSMDIQTPAKNDNVNKRPFSKVVDMEVDELSSNKRTKTTTKDKVIVNLEEEESINQGGHVVII